MTADFISKVSRILDDIDRDVEGGSQLNVLQTEVLETAVYPGRGTMQGLTYAVLGLNGEAGEVAEGVKKAIRDASGVLDAERREKLKAELGDVFWYVCAVADELDFTLSEVVEANLTKLRRRQTNGTISGSGSDR